MPYQPKYRQARPIVDWLAREVSFAPSRPIPGHFDIRNSPYIREPLETVQAERNRELWIIASWQSAKSLWLELCAIYLLVFDGQAAMWNSPTDVKADEFSQTRFSELLDDCAPAMRLLQGDRFANTKSLKRFVHCWILVQGAETLGNLQSKSVGYIFNDENWLWKPSHVAETRGRVTKFRRWLHLNATTAGEIHANVKMRIDEDGNAGFVGPDETAQAWMNSDQREWQLCCPACRTQPHGGLFIPRWEQMDFGGDASKNADGEWVLSRVKKNLRLVCPLCSAPMAYSVATLAALNDGARYVVTKPENTGTLTCWHYNAIVHYDWGKLAEEWIKANRARMLGDSGPLKMFIQRRLAETWESSKFIHTTTDLTAGGYRLGDKWPDARFTFLTVDVQKDCFFAVARHWGDKGISRQYAVERLLTIDEVEKLRMKLGIPVNWVGIDCGWSPEMVLIYCARFGYAALNGVKQRSFYHSEDNIHRLYSPVRWHRVNLGTIHDEGAKVPMFLFSTQAINDRLDTLRSLKGDEAKNLPTSWTVADDAPALFQKHMDACMKVERRTAQGMPFFEWHQIGSRPDHWRDAELMQCVMASMAGVIGAEAAPGAEEAEGKPDPRARVPMQGGGEG